MKSYLESQITWNLKLPGFSSQDSKDSESRMLFYLVMDPRLGCSSSTSTLQENMLHNSINTTSAATISVYNTEV